MDCISSLLKGAFSLKVMLTLQKSVELKLVRSSCGVKTSEKQLFSGFFLISQFYLVQQKLSYSIGRVMPLPVLPTALFSDCC